MENLGEKIVVTVGGIAHEILVKTIEEGEKVILIVGEVKHEIVIHDKAMEGKSVKQEYPPTSRIWNLIANPGSSDLACIYYCFSLAILLLYLLTMILNTMPVIMHQDEQGNLLPNPWLDWIQIVCAILCTLELVPRFLLSPSKKEFLLNMTTIVDILASLQFLVVCVLRLAGVVTYHSNMVATHTHQVGYGYYDEDYDEDLAKDYAEDYDEETQMGFYDQFKLWMRTWTLPPLLSLLTVLGSAWILKLVRYSSSLQRFFSQVWSTRNHVFLLLQMLVVMVIFFGTLAFWAEREEEDTMYTDLPTSFYWALVTLTSLGYGDITPTTVLGKIVACACAVSGVATIIIICTIITITITRNI